MLTPSNKNFKPPIPDSMIINEGQGLNVNITAGQTYRIRMINYAAFGAAMVHFNAHNMNVVMNDGAYIQKVDASQVRLAPAQRYDVLVTSADTDSGNYPFLVSLDLNRDWTNYTEKMSWQHNYTGYLVTNASQPLNKVDVVDKWQPVDDATFEPYDGASALGSYDKLINLDFKFCFDVNGYPR